MNKIKELNAKIGELASSMEIMNAKATPETAMTVKDSKRSFWQKACRYATRINSA